MSRDLSSAVLDVLEDDVVYPFFAIELLFDGDEVLRMWTGLGTLVYQGLSWFGTGNLLQIDVIEETSEIAAKGATVTLSGIPPEVLSLAISEPYQGRQAKIYFGTFSRGILLQENAAYILFEDGSSILLEDRKTDLTEIFAGYMDQMNIEEAENSSTVQLTIENKLIDLERPRTARFTNAYQKYLYPNDKGLEFVEDLQTKELFWGKVGP
jgi:hypothetical protein